MAYTGSGRPYVNDSVVFRHYSTNPDDPTSGYSDYPTQADADEAVDTLGYGSVAKVHQATGRPVD